MARQRTTPPDDEAAKGIEGGSAHTSGNSASTPLTVAISQRGVHTGEDFANLMSALMSDVIEGRISPAIANATCNAGGKLLKVVEMQYRYGQQQPATKPAFMLAEPKP